MESIFLKAQHEKIWTNGETDHMPVCKGKIGRYWFLKLMYRFNTFIKISVGFMCAGGGRYGDS